MDSQRLVRNQISIFVCLYVGYAVYVLNRKAFSFASPAIIEDLGLTKGDLGLVSSSQTLAYAIAKFSVGVLSDRVSARYLFIVGLVLTGIITILVSSFSSVYAFTAMMFMSGVTAGCGWPACAKILKKWYSPSQFGSLWGFLSSSMNLAGAVGPMLSTYLAVEYGWQTSLQVAGVMSIVYAVCCAMILKDSPSDIGCEEFIRSDEKKDESTTNNVREMTAFDLVRNPYLWQLFFGYMLVFSAKMCLQDWGQLYLIQERGHSVLTGSSFLSSLETGGLVGSFAVGFLSDRMVQVFSKKSQARTSVMLGNLLCASVFLYLMVFHVSEGSPQLWISFLGFVLGVCVYGSTCVYGVLAVENSPSHLSGSANAFVALGANVGGLMAGLPLSLLAKSYGWTGALMCINICLVIVFLLHLCTFNMKTTISIRKEDDDKQE